MARPRVLAVLVCAFLSGCGGATSPSRVSYAGQWSGTTAQDRPIAFTISPDEKVTSISIEHSFNGCAGAQTFSNLSVDIMPNVMCIPAPCPISVTSYRAFGYSAGPRDGAFTAINAIFLSANTAQGTVAFSNFPECGTVVGVGWNATRR